jgi:hypothetical protein
MQENPRQGNDKEKTRAGKDTDKDKDVTKIQDKTRKSKRDKTR